MKKIIKLFLVTILFMTMPVFAEEQPTITKEPETIVTEETVKEPIIIKSVKAETEDKKVQLRETEGLDIVFNELNQTATYTVKLENTSNEVLYVNDLEVENLSEEFISFSLSPKSVNAKIEPGRSKEIEVIVKTLDISQAGRNVNDDVTLKFILSREVVKNPETSSNWIVYLILITTLLITFSTMFSKVNKKKKLSLIMIGLLCGTIVVSADNAITVSLIGKVTYTSQNTMQESGITLSGYQTNYVNSKDIWKYSDQVKNIIISDNKIKPEDYEFRYDLSSNNSKKIYGYLVENNDEKIPYDLYIVANGIIYAPENATGLFAFPNVETINGLEFIEFENTKNMTAMFYGNEKLKSANVKSIDTSNATNTSYMFNGCDKLNVSEKDFNLAKVTNQKYMFSKTLNNIVKDKAVSDKMIDFTKISSATNGKGNYLKENTKNDTNPVYYYRGAVTNNNILFANFCWKMVRTTETGGTKLVYNGIPYNNTCNNTSTLSQIGTSAFNLERTSPTDVGYMYKERYPYKVVNIINTQKAEYIYGEDIEYKDGNYILRNTISGTDWTQDRIRIENKYRYTCLNSTGVCKNAYYVTSNANATYIYYQELSNGQKIDEYIDMLFPKNNITNEKNSTIKNKIDTWYEKNLVIHSKYIEDVIWCNNRNIVSKGAWNPTFSTNPHKDPLTFNGLKETSLDSRCENKNDRFTVEKTNGNGNLKYPIGLLTVEEYNMAGAAPGINNTNYYLYTGKWAWTITPAKYTDIMASNFYIGSNGNISTSPVEDSSGAVRPSISLKKNTKIIYGTGTVNDPYIVE